MTGDVDPMGKAAMLAGAVGRRADPVRRDSREELAARLVDLRGRLGRAPVQIWCCVLQEHSRVEWRGDVAHCLEPGCGLTSENTRPWLDDITAETTRLTGQVASLTSRLETVTAERDQLAGVLEARLMQLRSQRPVTWNRVNSDGTSPTRDQLVAEQYGPDALKEITAVTDQLRQRPGDQPLPKPADGPVMHDLVRADLQARLELGISRYGQPLRAHNGREPLRDAYEEILDLSVYLKQSMIERDTAVVSALVGVHERIHDLMKEIERQVAIMRRVPSEHRAVELSELECLLPGMNRVLGYILAALPTELSPAMTEALAREGIHDPEQAGHDRLNIEGEAWVEKATGRWQAAHPQWSETRPYLGDLIRWLMEETDRRIKDRNRMHEALDWIAHRATHDEEPAGRLLLDIADKARRALGTETP